MARPGASTKPRRGRSTRYDEAQVTEILRRMAGGESLTSICDFDPAYPDHSTVVNWYLEDKPAGFAARYRRARDIQAELLAERAIEVSKLEDSRSARVQLDALRWFAEKMSPRFANRTVSEHTGK